jgi:hypothetical protein
MKTSKLTRSRNGWKAKAKERGALIRSFRKTVNAARKQQLRDQQECDRLEKEIAQLRAALRASPGSSQGVAVMAHRAWCVFLVVGSIVSFRSVPRILRAFQPWLRVPVPIPHFTSVIHWTVRAGIALYQRVAALSEPWVAIIDCSIDIGTRKALVVLRVALSTLERKQGALGPRDCECIGLEVSHQWNGLRVADALARVFARSGLPAAILKDGGSDLQKGVRLFCAQRPQHPIYLIEDIGHFTANALKALYATSQSFLKFIQVTARAAARIRQTNLAWLLPPKIRTKGRFQGITAVARWAQKILELLSGPGRGKARAEVSQARRAFAGFGSLRPFLKRFSHTCALTERFLKLMKTTGLNPTTHQEAQGILAQLPVRSIVRRRLSLWLEKHLCIQRLLALGPHPLPVSTDAIESLFGLFKTVIQRNPQAELNRLVYLLPLLCGNHSPDEIDLALQHCSHTAMQDYIAQTLPSTLRQGRAQAFKNAASAVPKSGSCQRSDAG